MATSIEDIEIQLFLQAVKLRYGYDYQDYTHASLKRRLRLLKNNSKVEFINDMIHKVLHEDDFLKKYVIEIRQNNDNTIDFKIRKSDFIVHVGTLKQLEKKINNFKAFYQKAFKDKILDSYAVVNLKFDKQVICTKK